MVLVGLNDREIQIFVALGSSYFLQFLFTIEIVPYVVVVDFASFSFLLFFHKQSNLQVAESLLGEKLFLFTFFFKEVRLISNCPRKSKQ